MKIDSKSLFRRFSEKSKKADIGQCFSLVFLHLDRLEASVELLALVDLPDEEVAEASVDLRVGDVDHVLVDVKIDLKREREQFNNIVALGFFSQGHFP